MNKSLRSPITERMSDELDSAAETGEMDSSANEGMVLMLPVGDIVGC